MGGDHGEGSIQGSLERTARVSSTVFTAPPAAASYGAAVVLSVVLGFALEPGASGAVAGLLVLGVPALVAGPLSAPLATLLGGTLYYRRAALLAAVGVASVGAVVLLATPVRLLWDIAIVDVILLGYMGLAGLRHGVLYMTSDNRHLRTLPVTLLQPLVALPFVATRYPFGPDEIVLAVVLPVVFLAPVILTLHVFDAPLRRTFRVSASELYRYYLDHLTSGRMDGEAILNRFAEPIRAKFSVVAFERDDGSKKAVVVVPALHPGPIGRLGGSDLPLKVAEAVLDADLVMVPHGAATHDFNPVSTTEVERLGSAVADLVERMTYTHGGSRAVTAGSGVRVTSQLFGDGALLTYTSWPAPIDDVEYGVGHAAELNARLGGAKKAAFVDCHNSLEPGSGGVFTCTPRADEIADHARIATEGAAAGRVDTLKVGIAQDTTTFTRKDGIGEQGVQVLAVEAGGQRHVYVLWDGNNAVPAVTGLIGEALEGVVDGYQVMTTDNHSVNAVAGAYGPVGHLAPPERVAAATRLAVEQALSDLEPVKAGFDQGALDDFRVYGHQKTVQLTASINVMTSVALELVVTTVALQAMAAALVFIALAAF